MLKIIEGLGDNIVAVEAYGKVNGKDYETVLVPAIEEKLQLHGKVRVLYVMGREFDGFTAEAVWDDAKIGIRHLTAYEKVAVVSDVNWIRNAVRFFSFAIPCPVKVFGNDQFPEAKQWVTE